MRQHARHEPFQLATRAFSEAVWKFAAAEEVDYFSMLLLLSCYQADLVREVFELPTVGAERGYVELVQTLDTVRKQLVVPPTDIEWMRMAADEINAITTFLLRDERQPVEPHEPGQPKI